MTIETIFKDNYNSLVRYAKVYCPFYAEDIVLEVFTKFIPLYKAKKISFPKTWLARCVKRLAIDYARRDRAAVKRYLLYTAQDFEHYEQPVDIIPGIIAAIKVFPGRIGQVLRMHFLQHKSTREIAAEMQVTLKTICNMKLRGCASLARQFYGFK